jgi:hypothetical protein
MSAGEVDVDDDDALANPTGDGRTSGDDGLDEEDACADDADDENSDGDDEVAIGANTDAAAAAA